jgi:hypothetical protein
LKGNTMQEAGNMPAPPIFILILDEVLVARDIELIIGDVRSDAKVVVARTLEDGAAIVPPGRVEAAFVQRDAARFLASAIGRRVSGDGGRVVLVGQEPSEAMDGVSVLPFPFARDDVAALLADATH